MYGLDFVCTYDNVFAFSMTRASPSDNTAGIASSEPADVNDFEAIFTMIIDFFKKIFAFLLSTVGVSVSL